MINNGIKSMMIELHILNMRSHPLLRDKYIINSSKDSLTGKIVNNFKYHTNYNKWVKERFKI